MLTAPAAGATFTSTPEHVCDGGTDDHGVRRVEFWVDGARVARDTACALRGLASVAAGGGAAYGVHTVVRAGLRRSRKAHVSAAVTVTRDTPAARQRARPLPGADPPPTGRATSSCR